MANDDEYIQFDYDPKRPRRAEGATGRDSQRRVGPSSNERDQAGNLPPLWPIDQRQEGPTEQKRKKTRKQNFSDRDDFERMVEEALQPQASVLSRLLRSKRMKHAIVIGIVFIVLIVLFGIASSIFRGKPGGSEVTIKVENGDTFSVLAGKLEDKGVVSNSTLLKFYSKLNEPPQLQVGEYSFNKGMSVSQIYNQLSNGPKLETNRLVIPEGYRIAQVADEIGKIKGFSSLKFIEVVKSGKVRSRYQPDGQNSLEGFLFPDTYFITSGDDEERILKKMVSTFDDRARLLGIDDSRRLIGKSPYEALIVASLIESEVRGAGERAKVSQVVENRLRENMPLQFDSTILYGMGNPRNYLLDNDKKLQSLYNSYTNGDLPPTPISNPGEASIRAALNPEPGPWLYFVVINQQGDTKFATTYDEHLRNIEIAKQNGVIF